MIGRLLFFDPILSSTGTVSCSTCHQPRNGFTSAGPPPKLGGGTLARRAPSLWNRGGGKAFFWDGRAATLEAQALEVIGNPDEMGGPVEAAVARVRSKYPAVTTAAELAAALAAFERSLESPPTRFDQYRSGENVLALSESEARGWDLFRGRLECYRCHTGPNLTDDRLHDTGLGGRFKTPGLRGVKATGPWGHDARFKTLGDVLDHYDRGGGELKPLRLTEQERADLLAFLNAL